MRGQGTTVLKALTIGLTLSLLPFSAPAEAHPGRTASDGCHNDRKAGKRHCHGAKKTKTTPRSNLGSQKKTPSSRVYYKNCTAARAARRPRLCPSP